MIALCLDIGSSGVRAGLYDTATRSALGAPAVCSFENRTVTLAVVRATVQQTLAVLGDLSSVEVIGHSSFSPSLCVMGDDPALEEWPVLSHADRRSLAQARRIEQVVGAEKFLGTVGNQPVPGGISVTSLCWLMEHEPAAMKRVRMVGHLTTWLIRELTGQRAIDYSQACFTGLWDIAKAEWSRPILAALQIDPAWLPAVGDAGRVAGKVTDEAGRQYGLPSGAKVLSGMVDTSGAILCSDLASGTLVHSLGTTDVLAMLIERPQPSPFWLTRHLGTMNKWLAVTTIAAGGSMLDWLHRTLFADFDQSAFYGLARKGFGALPKPAVGTDSALTVSAVNCNDKLHGPSKQGPCHTSSQITGKMPVPRVSFEPYLAGSRLSVEQRTAAFTGLTLATTREDMLAAALAAYRAQTAESLDRLRRLQAPTGQVLVTGGASPLADLLHGDWPADYRYQTLPDANLRGLAVLAAHSTRL